MEWVNVQVYAKREGVSESTVYRLIKAKEVRAQRVGRQWRVALVEDALLTEASEHFHQGVVLDLILDAAFDLNRFQASLPTIWHLSYRPEDPSNSLEVSVSDGVKRVRWSMDCERETNWRFAIQHLETGLPNAWKALNEVSDSFGRYCHRLTEAEVSHRKLAQTHLRDDASEDLTIDNGRFFRFILGEVDEAGAEPSRQDYSLTTTGARVSARFRGAVILSAPTQEIAQRWTQWHLAWRRKFVKTIKPELSQLRASIKAGADVFAATASEVEIRGRVPGRCDRCPETR